MATFLFNEIVFGPVKSRRLGLSLGINLLPVNRKLCNFDCIYCECGLNDNNERASLPSREEIYSQLRIKLSDMKEKKNPPDVITFAGNGEPTLHPEFPGIIDDTIKLRDTICPSALISVLSNATMLHKAEIVNALKRVDQNILKFDSANENTVMQLNRPNKFLNTETLLSQFKQFDGKLIIQSMFTRGEVNGTIIDNTLEREVDAWLKHIEIIHPEMVMIYTIERDTPFEGLKKIPLSELNYISKRVEALGIKSQVSG